MCISGEQQVKTTEVSTTLFVQGWLAHDTNRFFSYCINQFNFSKKFKVKIEMTTISFKTHSVLSYAFTRNHLQKNFRLYHSTLLKAY